MEISNILKQTRLKKGISISQLSDITNIKPRSLSYYESGRRSPNSLNKCVLLFNILGLDIVDTSSIFFVEEYENNKNNNDNKCKILTLNNSN